jgi:hypothetical protein
VVGIAVWFAGYVAISVTVHVLHFASALHVGLELSLVFTYFLAYFVVYLFLDNGIAMFSEKNLPTPFNLFLLLVRVVLVGYPLVIVVYLGGGGGGRGRFRSMYSICNVLMCIMWQPESSLL